MGDGGAERPGSSPFTVHVDPLVIASGLSEQVNPGLVDLHPVGVAQVGSHGGRQVIGAIEDGGHGSSGWWSESKVGRRSVGGTDTTLPVSRKARRAL